MNQRSYYSRIANNIQRAYYFNEQFKSDIWYYFDFRSLISDIKTFRQTWKKFCDNYFKRTGIILFGLIEHTETEPFHFHIHAIGITFKVLTKKFEKEVQQAWMKFTKDDSSATIEPPIPEDPLRRFRYSLKAISTRRLRFNYAKRSKGRRVKPTDKFINYHVCVNLNPLPWSGQRMPSDRFQPSKLKKIVDDYFSKEKNITPSIIPSLV